MAENNRNSDQQSDRSTQQDREMKGRQTQSASGGEMQDENPQRGTRWNNYQTRELSDEGTGEGKATTPKNE